MTLIETAIAELRAGKPVLVTDSSDRENEGDLICAAEKVTPEMVNFMVREGGGMLCVGVGGGVTGFGADLLIIDDPYVDWDDAWSSASRSML